MRVQLALNVTDIDEAVAFYTAAFGTEPHKRRPGYANFEIAQPPLKLVLFEAAEGAERLNHLGVEVTDGADVDAAGTRLETAGILERTETGELCCHAVQDKVWTADPDGARWEWYVINDDDPDGLGVGPSDPVAVGAPASAEAGCCN